MSQGDQLDGAVMPSPPKKLQTYKDPSDSPSIRKSTIRILGGQSATPLPTGKSVVETVKNLASIPAKVVSASTNDISQSVPLLAQQQQPDTAKNSSVITQTIANERSQVNQLAARVVKLPRQNLLSDHGKKPSNVPLVKPSNVPIVKPSNVPIVKPSNVPIVPNQVSGLAGATAPLVTPKLEIGKVQNTSSLLSNPAYARALLIKQQERLLQQFKLGSSQHQEQQQQNQLYIKGPGKVLCLELKRFYSCFSAL